MMTREEAIQYVSFQIDDTHDGRSAKPGYAGSDDHLVGLHESPGFDGRRRSAAIFQESGWPRRWLKPSLVTT